jgi:5-methylthioadenosine/S-adenosylhomocysteine deaminase
VNFPSILLEDVQLIPGSDGDPIVCDLYIEGGVVEVIDESRSRKQPTDIRLDCSAHVALPGLANLHVHCRPQRALSDGMPVPVWHRRVDLISRHMTDEDSYVGGLIAIGELLLSGVTSCVIMTRHFAGAARAAEVLGIRAAIVPLAGDGGGVERGDLDDLSSALDVVSAYGDSGSRVAMWPGFDSPLTTSIDGMRLVSNVSVREQLGFHTHMAETRYEVETFASKRGTTEPEALADAGLLGRNTLLAHCNWLEDHEIDALAESETAVVHNPTSNMRFASGICRVPELRAAGVRVALGTDGMLSGYQLNMFGAMRTTAMLHRMSSGDAALFNSHDLLGMVTGVAGSIMQTNAGSLNVGDPADIAVVSMSGLHLQPYRRGPDNDSDLLNLIVWCAQPSDVEHVICAGELLVRDRLLTRMPISNIRQRARESDARIRPLIG